VRAFGALLTAGLIVVPLASAATFGRPAEIPLAQAPAAVTAFDATQDGIEDVVVANAAAPVLTVLAGKQDGSFEPPLETGTGPASRAVAVADFDNDGGDDLAVAGGNEIAIYTGSDATLVRRTSLTASSVSTIVAADLDLDGNIDLLAGAQNQPMVTVFPGVGDGTFLQGQQYAAGRAAVSLFVADFDSDELPDVAVGGNGVSVLIGNGDGTLGPPVSVVGAAGTSALTGDDLDSDGDVDLAVARRPNTVDVLLDDGAGQFSAGGSFRVGGTPATIGAAYIDDDGMLDLVTANRGTNDVSILLGLGDGQFRPESRVRVGKGPVGMAIEDLDSLGSNDLVTANRLSKSVTVLLNGADAPQPVVCLVPAVARRKLAVARRLVGSAHCKVAALRRKYSRRVKKGRVISVSPVPGSRRPVDTPVTLLVSRGPKPKR
jgi:hypothetical protein